MRYQSKNGFTLIEVIIAAFIFFLSIAVISQIFGMAAQRIEKLEKRKREVKTVMLLLSKLIENPKTGIYREEFFKMDDEERTVPVISLSEELNGIKVRVRIPATKAKR